MAKRTIRNASTPSLNFDQYKKHLIPSTLGGVVAYLFSGVAMLAVAVFAAVWVGNMIGHAIHKK
jgi:Na+/H+-translocating membrane pyrophosphatase